MVDAASQREQGLGARLQLGGILSSFSRVLRQIAISWRRNFTKSQCLQNKPRPIKPNYYPYSLAEAATSQTGCERFLDLKRKQPPLEPRCRIETSKTRLEVRFFFQPLRKTCRKTSTIVLRTCVAHLPEFTVQHAR